MKTKKKKKRASKSAHNRPQTFFFTVLSKLIFHIINMSQDASVSLSVVYVMSKTKYNRRCVLDHIYKSLFWPLLMDCFELQREQNIFRIFWEGNLNLWRKINSTDGAKSEHCYALCSRIRLSLELKMWNLNVQIIIAAWNSDFKIHCQIVNT